MVVLLEVVMAHIQQLMDLFIKGSGKMTRWMGKVGEELVITSND